MFNLTSVDGIVKQFAKTVEKLEALAEKKAGENAAIRDSIAVAEMQATVNENEIARAKEISQNLKTMIGQ